MILWTYATGKRYRETRVADSASPGVSAPMCLTGAGPDATLRLRVGESDRRIYQLTMTVAEFRAWVDDIEDFLRRCSPGPG